MKNEILQEVWQSRDKVAKRYKYDLDTMVKALQKMERSGDNPIVDRTKKKNDKKLRRLVQQ
jgi:hypothetical protein